MRARTHARTRARAHTHTHFARRATVHAMRTHTTAPCRACTHLPLAGATRGAMGRPATQHGKPRSTCRRPHTARDQAWRRAPAHAEAPVAAGANLDDRLGTELAHMEPVARPITGGCSNAGCRAVCCGATDDAARRRMASPGAHMAPASTFRSLSGARQRRWRHTHTHAEVSSQPAPPSQGQPHPTELCRCVHGWVGAHGVCVCARARVCARRRARAREG